MRDMIKSSLIKFGVIPKANPSQSKAQSNSINKEPPRAIDSEGEISDSEQEGPESGITELVLMAEEQQAFDSSALASPSVTPSRVRAPLWRFSEENPKVYSQARIQIQNHPSVLI